MKGPSEDSAQIGLAAWLDSLWYKPQAGEARRLLWCHVPNGGNRSPITGARLKLLGTKRGVPDILIFDPPPLSDYVGMAVELKRKSGGRVSEEQAEWILKLHRVGWAAKVCHGFDDAKQAIEDMGY